MEESTWQYRKQSEPQESSSGDGWFMGDSRAVKAWVHGARARHIAWARRAEQALSNDADTEKIKKAEKMLMQRKGIAKESKG